jgi:hypothetical protein
LNAIQDLLFIAGLIIQLDEKKARELADEVENFLKSKSLEYGGKYRTTAVLSLGAVLAKLGLR